MNGGVTYIHTIPALVQRFEDLTKQYLPGIRANHVVESAYFDAEFNRGYLSTDEEDRLVTHARIAQERGDAAVVVTCSFLGTSVDRLSDRVDVPWHRVDEAMARRALGLGNRIGVIATARSSLTSTQALLHRLAAERETEPTVIAHLCDGAFEALDRGDVAQHDAAVRDGLLQLANQCDVIALSQASMARVADQCADELGDTPVLTSPDLCMEHLADSLG